MLRNWPSEGNALQLVTKECPDWRSVLDQKDSHRLTVYTRKKWMQCVQIIIIHCDLDSSCLSWCHAEELTETKHHALLRTVGLGCEALHCGSVRKDIHSTCTKTGAYRSRKVRRRPLSLFIDLWAPCKKFVTCCYRERWILSTKFCPNWVMLLKTLNFRWYLPQRVKCNGICDRCCKFTERVSERILKFSQCLT